MLTVLAGGACERIVGIHASTTGPSDAAVPDERADAADGVHEAPFDALDAKDVEGDEVAAHDAGATMDAVVNGDQDVGDAGPRQSDAPDAKFVDASTVDGGKQDGIGDKGASDAAGLMCTPDPSVSMPIQATAFRYDTGPNNTKTGKGGCSFLNAQLPTGPDIYYGAVDNKLLASASRCGSCMHVVGPKGAVDVRIVDVVSPLAGATGETISVDSLAKAILAPPEVNPSVTVSFVPCVITGTIQISFAGNTDPAVLVMNYNNQVASVQFVGAAGNVNLMRQGYNVWTPPSNFAFNGGAVTLQLTDVFGNVLQTEALTVSTTPVDTLKQFPGCPP